MAKIYTAGSPPIYPTYGSCSHHQPLAKRLDSCPDNPSVEHRNSAFSYWREHRAEQAIEKLRHLLPSYAHLIRDGTDVHIPASDVVPGDLLILAEGDNIPADARVVEEYGLRVNNASLTGEAVAARKTAEASILPGLMTWNALMLYLPELLLPRGREKPPSMLREC